MAKSHRQRVNKMIIAYDERRRFQMPNNTMSHDEYMRFRSWVREWIVDLQSFRDGRARDAAEMTSYGATAPADFGTR